MWLNKVKLDFSDYWKSDGVSWRSPCYMLWFILREDLILLHVINILYSIFRTKAGKLYRFFGEKLGRKRSFGKNPKYRCKDIIKKGLENNKVESVNWIHCEV